MPERIQRKRTKGWRMPECSCGCGKPARYVGRGTKYGNPFIIGAAGFRLPNGGAVFYRGGRGATPQIVVDLYRKWIVRTLSPTELRGHDLACWCPLGSPCHADVLLEIANA
ncbi:DUF4326 domain-containing protein [Mycolicibacterium fortuitum]|uniref:DUF4326 domain-containing protein n=1 Tax=Mycolicibacterium fortuitum TaxID=1766 RepID=UPI0007EA5EE6|nr:DUF4326 domain-containing protein [Mycolicibacterium fortuitum]OBB49920.1 hypothetical protein A5754_29255 [Mycolicibacterium fortuitum]OBB77873.1 hypothetical protein A5755_10680 [Mycolicibacterium fortuitum]OBF89694.1 hypothetical protein A5751_00035 [Mycolicibacterium fortuitum]